MQRSHWNYGQSRSAEVAMRGISPRLLAFRWSTMTQQCDVETGDLLSERRQTVTHQGCCVCWRIYSFASWESTTTAQAAAMRGRVAVLLLLLTWTDTLLQLGKFSDPLNVCDTACNMWTLLVVWIAFWYRPNGTRRLHKPHYLYFPIF